MSGLLEAHKTSHCDRLGQIGPEAGGALRVFDEQRRPLAAAGKAGNRRCGRGLDALAAGPGREQAVRAAVRDSIDAIQYKTNCKIQYKWKTNCKIQ